MTVYIGIDWSEQKHDIVFMNPAGADLAAVCIDHTLEGFAQFDAVRRQLGLTPMECMIGIETAYSLLVDYLWDHHYQRVYVLPPKQVHDNQGRFRRSGAKDDPSDARLIADILRTDHGRLAEWQPDSLSIRQMRAQVSWILQLNQEINRTSNRLRATLLRYYPQALKVFASGIRAQIALEFILAYPNPHVAKALSWKHFKAFAQSQAYTHIQHLDRGFVRLHADYPETNSETIQIFQPQAVEQAGLLLGLIRTQTRAMRRLRTLYRQHPKHDVFASLPGTGDFLGPALLAKFGDQLQRFPSPAVVQALAGTSPITKRSGKRRSIQFRRACDKEWRYICQEWAFVLVSQQSSPIAMAYYHQIRPRCRSTEHAYRCLANRWLAIAWKLWQSNQLYDEAFHFQQRALRSKPQ